MRRILFAAIVPAVLWIPAAVAEGRVHKREAVQQKRVGEGVKSGELTRKEAVQLEKKEAQLHRQIRRDRADGGGLTARERINIEKKQDKLSRDIAKQKHDKQELK